MLAAVVLFLLLLLVANLRGTRFAEADQIAVKSLKL